MTLNPARLVSISSRGKLQMQFSAILAEVKSLGYRIEEVIPDGLQDHFQDMTELKLARRFIEEFVEREKGLQAENGDLLVKLEAKEAEIGNQHKDFHALKVDLQQAQYSIDIYKKIAHDMAKRAERCQYSMAQAFTKQMVTDDLIEKVKRLQTELHDLQTVYQDLLQENIHADQQLAAVILQIQLLQAADSEISDAHAALIVTLELDHAIVSAAVNNKTLLLRETDKIHSAIESEIAPLNNFFGYTVTILGIYQSLSRSLSNPNSLILAGLPNDLAKILRAAAEDLEIYEVVHKTLDAGGIAQE